MRQAISAVLLLSVVAGTALTAVQTNVDLLAIDEALMLIRSGSLSELARFNELYRVKVEKAPVDYLEVVTPFRRIVLTGSARAAAGDRGFGQRQAIDLLAEAGDRLDVYAEITLNPLNTYIGVPEYVVALVNGSGDAHRSDRDHQAVTLDAAAPRASGGTALSGDDDTSSARHWSEPRSLPDST